MDDYDDDEGSGRSKGALRVLCVLAVGVAGGFAIRPLLASHDEPSASGSSVALEAAPTTVSDAATTPPETTDAAAVETTEPTATTEAAETTEAVQTTEAAETTESVQTTEAAETTESVQTTEAAETTEATATTEAAETTEAPETNDATATTGFGTDAVLAARTTESTDVAETTGAPDTTDSPDTTAAVETTDVPSTTEAPVATFAPMPPSDPAVTTSSTPTTVTVDSTTPVSEIPYDTMPDGSPEPVIVTFGPDVITLTGAVPSAEASAFLSAYAAANSQTPGLPIDNQLIVNESVPIGVGVRVIELESPRFADGSAAIGTAHARQLDRVAGVMQSLPHLTVVVVGHADQRGDEATNLDLSQERADAVIAYLADRGVEGSRMSARAVGEADLLSTSDDVESLTLNRRTEFIFYGVLLTDPTALGLG